MYDLIPPPPPPGLGAGHPERDGAGPGYLCGENRVHEADGRGQRRQQEVGFPHNPLVSVVRIILVILPQKQ